METYVEKIYRFRVLRQLNDVERNPEGEWSLVFSSNDIGCAEEVAMEERASYAKFGDIIKVEDAGEETLIERPVY